MSYKPDLVVISGLHLLESEDSEFRMQRLRDLARYLEVIDSKVPIHLELASMVEKHFLKALVTAIFPLVDSVGLNEQELSFITVALDGPHRTDGDLRQWPPEIGMLRPQNFLFSLPFVAVFLSDFGNPISMIWRPFSLEYLVTARSVVLKSTFWFSPVCHITEGLQKIIATHFVPSIATHFVPSIATHFVPSTATHFVPSTATHFVPSTATHFAPSIAIHFVPSSATHFVPSIATHFMPSIAIHFVLNMMAKF